jgi:uncharacterized protein
MAVVYFDSSAFVRLLVDEDGTDLAAELWDGCDLPVSSRIAYAEVCAVLAAAARADRLGEDDLERAERDWQAYWAAVGVVELTPRVGQRAGELAVSHSLRGADGIHLASALALTEAEPVMAVWDLRLQGGAMAAGLSVAPAPGRSR